MRPLKLRVLEKQWKNDIKILVQQFSEMQFQPTWSASFSKFSGGACPQTPLARQKFFPVAARRRQIFVFHLEPTHILGWIRACDQPWGTDQNLREVYVRNFHRIRDTETINRRSKIFLRYLNHTNSPLIESIPHVLEDIFLRQPNAFKINLSFSFILQHRETGEFRYHYASNNDQILNSPRLIRNQHDLGNLLDFLASQDFPSHLKDQRPNTKWVIERIVSLRIHLVITRYPLGNPPPPPS